MKKWLLFCAIVLFLPSAQALTFQEYHVQFDLQPNGDVQESVQLAFDAVPADTATFIQLGAARDIHVLVGSEIPVSLSQDGSDTKASFTIPAGATQATIRFLASGLVFQAGDVSQFFTNINTPALPNLTVAVVLPKGYALYRNTFAPSTGVAGSDGERISITWTLAGGETGFSVQYEPVVKSSAYILPGIGILALAAVAGIFIFFRRKNKQSFLLSFFEDERAVLKELEEKKVMYQNTLERNMHFSRAKMTRMLQKFERMGLVRREKAGRTNKIEWVGGNGKKGSSSST